VLKRACPNVWPWLFGCLLRSRRSNNLQQDHRDEAHRRLPPARRDAKAGKLYLEIPRLDASGNSPDILYTHSLPYGTGSNDLGLDRGQISRGQLVRFQRTGPKVLLVEPNQQFRSTSNDPAEQLAVRQSFPESVLYGFKVEAEDPNGTVLVDATDFFLRDAHDVVGSLTRTQQGTYKLDATRSTIALDATKAFPKNTEVEAILTFTTDGPARGSSSATYPDPHALTVREHQSFVELPAPASPPRRRSRAGHFPTSYRDYNVPVSEQLDQQFIIRHRLVKKTICKTNCEPSPRFSTTSITVPPSPSALPSSKALVGGPGLRPPAGPKAPSKLTYPINADPMDVYNMIQWVHRHTRGWSWRTVVDPRTGEV
jgi:hypothetical protein